MTLKSLGKIIGGQDGAVCNGFLFIFNHKGICTVYNTKDCLNGSGEIPPFSVFTLDKTALLKPHSNSVMFGNEYFCEGDEFPLLYSNIYNSYSTSENKMEGVTCVYRLQRKDAEFSSTLVQVIEIGFTKDPLWKSENVQDVRPYGNFAIDPQKSVYYAFTMRDEDNSTRYFAFDLPKLSNGICDESLGAKRVTLQKEDVKFHFNCEYHRYIQGACCYDGLIYSLEGFTDNEQSPPAIRIIDVESRAQKEMHLFADLGTTIEPEMIDFEAGLCYYCDHLGNLYLLEV